MAAVDPGLPAFVGRSRELAIIEGQLSRSLAGDGRIVMLSGEAGIGKTRLCQEFRSLAVASAHPVVWGRCVDGDWTPPFLPWVEVLESLDRLFGRERLLALAGNDAPLVARLLPGWRSDAGDVAASPLSPEEERFRLFDAVVQLLGRLAADEPFVIVLDDLHWADHGTVRLLAHLARFIERMPLLVIVTFRSAPLERGEPLSLWLPDAHRNDHVTLLPIAGLDRDDVLHLIEAILHQPASPAMLDAILASSVGNPFFAAELIRHAQAETGWSPSAPELPAVATGVPESIRETVLRRLARCAPATQQVLQHLSICLGGFRFEVARAFIGIPEDDLLDAIDEGLQAGFLHLLDPRTETYDFAHEIVRLVLSDDWTPSRRIRLHRRLAESLERLYAGQERAHAAELAVQYSASAALSGAERGIDYALAASEQAAGRFAWERVVSFLEMAASLAGQHAPERESSILGRLAIAQSQAMMLDAATVTTRRAIAAMRAADVPPDDLARFIARAAAALKDNGADPADWSPFVLEGIALLGETRDLTWARLTLLLERFTPITTGPILAARWEGIDGDALRIARTEGDEEDYARTLQPFQLRSRQETDSLRERIRAWRQPAAINRALMMVGADLMYTHGAFTDAVPFFHEMIVRAREAGSIVTQAEAWVRLTLANYSLGRFSEAAEAEEAARELVGRLPPAHRLHASFWWVRAMRADLIDGDWEPIARYWSSFITDPAKRETAIVLDDAALAALAHVRIGEMEEGRRILQALTDVLGKLDASIWLLNGAVDVGGIVVWELEARDAAPIYAGLAEDLIRRGIGDYPCCSNRLTIARMAALTGDLETAARAFAGARQELECSGQLPLLAITDLDEARIGGDGASALIVRAEHAFRDLGMRRYLDQTPTVRTSLDQADKGSRRVSLPAGLTERELDILRLVARGYSDRRISEELFVSPRTVHTHLRNMLNKTELSNRTELSVWAVERGLVPR